MDFPVRRSDGNICHMRTTPRVVASLALAAAAIVSVRHSGDALGQASDLRSQWPIADFDADQPSFEGIEVGVPSASDSLDRGAVYLLFLDPSESVRSKPPEFWEGLRSATRSYIDSMLTLDPADAARDSSRLSIIEYRIAALEHETKRLEWTNNSLALAVEESVRREVQTTREIVLWALGILGAIVLAPFVKGLIESHTRKRHDKTEEDTPQGDDVPRT